MAKNPLHCSFCGRSRDEVKILIAGQEGHICENCVEHAQEIIVQELQQRQDEDFGAAPLQLSLEQRGHHMWRDYICEPEARCKRARPAPAIRILNLGCGRRPADAAAARPTEGARLAN